MFDRISDRMRARSAALLLTIDGGLNRILFWWLLVAGSAAALRIAMASHSIRIDAPSAFGSYLLLVLAPVASTLLALRWFSNDDAQQQPRTRLARIGNWRDVSRSQAERHALYGAGGVMVSLLVGIMLNVPVLALEYLVAMPPMPAAAPRWLDVLHFAMTFQVVAFSSLYMIAFVAALRHVALFPRLLVAIWLGDLAMQLITAQLAVSAQLPPVVAAALHPMLDGNIKKVLISAALWLPYLLLSKRVNVTYRHRVTA